MIFNSTFPPIQIPKTGLIQHLFDNRKFITPEDKVLFIDVRTKKTLTFGQTKENILRFAAGLQDRCGGTALFLNPDYNAIELRSHLEMIKPKVLIAFPSNIRIALEATANGVVPFQNIFVFGELSIESIQPYTKYLLKSRMAVPVEYTEEEAKNSVALLCLSSGTTGKSKAVMLSHTNIATNFEQHFESYKYSIDPACHRSLGVLPFYHLLGLYAVLNEAFYHGIPLYVLQKFDFVSLCKTIQNEKITRTYLVPPIILRLSNNPIVDYYDLSSLEIVHYGAAPVSKDLDLKVNKRLKRSILRNAYGLSEVGITCYVGLVPNDKGSVGKLVSGMTAKIVNEKAKEVGYNESGELWLKGPNVMKGYLNNPEATRDCIDDEGYLHTGDIATIDTDNDIYIVGRIKELIKFNGFQVPPAELEAHLLECPIVADCAVIGIYDETKETELPSAFIVLAPGIEDSAETKGIIMKFIAERVIAYKRIHKVFFINEIPKSVAGKILRRELRNVPTEDPKN
ncbi:hypothetical protein CLU79DRAFT_864911 [Phycomyces nitens]|nr:hypothetical protein CLU79DRAFT_864911 [Phycomyces nitens]